MSEGVYEEQEWALIFVGANYRAAILSSSYGISWDVYFTSNDPFLIGIDIDDLEPGLYIWKGISREIKNGYIEYEGATSSVRYGEISEWLKKHEPYDKEE